MCEDRAHRCVRRELPELREGRLQRQHRQAARSELHAASSTILTHPNEFWMSLVKPGEIPKTIWWRWHPSYDNQSSKSILLGASRTQRSDNGVYANQAQESSSAEQQDVNWNFNTSAQTKKRAISTNHSTESFGADSEPVATDLSSCLFQQKSNQHSYRAARKLNKLNIQKQKKPQGSTRRVVTPTGRTRRGCRHGTNAYQYIAVCSRS